MSIIAIIIFGALVLLIIYVFLNGIYEIFEVFVDFYYGDKLHLRSLQKKPLEAQYKRAIANHFPYYKKLKPHKQDLFERKVQWFIDSREFVNGADLDELHPDMIALVSATAIQVTFGFPRVYLKHFKRVYIYNDAFQSPNTGKYHYGEVNGKGVIVLSWKNFVQGLFNETNGRNLGLHEMAHALKVENAIQNKEYGFLNQKSYGRFHAEGRWEMHRMRNGEANFFRDYAAINDHEFFAVAMENFFERPAAFRAHNPKLYTIMTRMLNQDPLKMSMPN